MKKVIFMAFVMAFTFSSLTIFPLMNKASAWSPEDERQRQYILELQRQRERELEYKRRQEQKRQEHYQRTYGGRDQALRELRKMQETLQQDKQN